MVKNKTGGNKAKKFARKNVNPINRKLRFATEEGEVYSIVTKVVGNGQCVVMGVDNKERLCFIRNKFSGRNKHSNLITLNSWVIVGVRDWETQKDGKLEKCDLLEIYSHEDKNRLIQECNTNFSVLIKEENKFLNIEESDKDPIISFNSNNYEQESEDNNSDNESISEIDFDDI